MYLRTPIRLLRLMVLTVGVLWILRMPIVRGQGFTGECIKQFATENGSPCFDCCPQQPEVTNLIYNVIDSSQGIWSSLRQSTSTGRPAHPDST